MIEVCLNESHEDSYFLTKEDENDILNYDILGIGYSCIVEKLILNNIQEVFCNYIVEINVVLSQIRFKYNKVFEINVNMNFNYVKYYSLNVTYIFNNQKNEFWNSISFCKNDFIIQKNHLMNKMYLTLIYN
jgi:hypothetical protein